MSESLQTQGLQQARLPCPSTTPRAYSNSCLLSWWCHPTILSSDVHFSSCLQSCPASGSFLVSQFFTSGGQSIGVLASASVLPMNVQDWFPLGWTGWISLLSKGFSRVFSNTTVQKRQFFSTQLSFLFIYLFSILFYFLTLQYRIGFAIYQNESATGIHVFPILNPPPFSLPIPYQWFWSSSAPAPGIQYLASNLDWRLVSCMILYMFQCHSPKSSHPLPLPPSPKDCSIHQCLFCCLVYRVIVTTFLNSIYMH